MRTLIQGYWPLALGWVIVLSAVGLCLMGADKGRAKRGAWRIPEKTLFAVALLGGAAGTTLGMRAFRHKTRHWYFQVGMPLILLCQIGLAVWIFLW